MRASPSTQHQHTESAMMGKTTLATKKEAAVAAQQQHQQQMPFLVISCFSVVRRLCNQTEHKIISRHFFRVFRFHFQFSKFNFSVSCE